MKIERPVSKQPIPENAQRVFKGVIFDIYQWEQAAFDGSVRTFEKIKRADTAVVIPVTPEGKIILAKEEQPAKKLFITTIGGRVEEDEDPFLAAKRELLEETGFESNDWTLFSAIQPHNKIDWAIYTFIAKGCKKVAEQNLDGGEKIELLELSFDEFLKVVTEEEFEDVGLKMRVLAALADDAKMKSLREGFGI